MIKKKWLNWDYIKGRAKDGFYALGVILLAWMAYKYSVGTPINIIEKEAMSLDHKICITGDTGTGEHDQRVVAQAMMLEDCDELRIMGDVIYRHGLEDENDPQFFTKFWDIYKSLDIPILLTMGNHDTRRNVGAWVKLAYKYNKIVFPYYYYAENYGKEVCILSLNSTVFTTVVKGKHEKEQEKFTEEFLLQSRDNCKLSISVAHHPYLSHGSHGDSHGRVKDFYEKYLVGKIDLILAGHDHNMSYEGQVSGTHNIVSGAGSKLRIPSKYEKEDLTKPLQTERGHVNFNIGYHVLTYKGSGEAEIQEKYIVDGKLIQGFKLNFKGKGIR